MRLDLTALRHCRAPIVGRLPVVDKFLVPYEENRHFVGRRELLQLLREALCEVTEKQYNHRVALYGLGGVGKTQTALAYVYSKKEKYDGIYWINAVSEASLLSSFQEIGKRAGCLETVSDTESVDVAKAVLLWLRQQESWLVIFDNLDDITIIDGFLPDSSSGRHTLITTRNPNASGIPAKGLEVGLPSVDEAVEHLLNRASVIGTEREQIEAACIAKELGYLPLAIEQAAAYVRELSGNIFTFLPDYHKNTKELHEWVPQGTWTYSNSVASTWLLPFQLIKAQSPRASRLLQLFAFLNPDRVALEFLARNAKAFDDDPLLKSVFSHRLELWKALVLLERLSLIKWSRTDHNIVIHRLVQSVMKDNMPDTESKIYKGMVVSLCNIAFPTQISDETRQLCREYQDQIIVPLVECSIAINTEKAAHVLSRVGRFLMYDGKFAASEHVLLRAIGLYTEILGQEHSDTLTTMNSLALTYWRMGRPAASAQLHEKLFDIMNQANGKEHPDTLKSMNNLAEAYRRQGRVYESLQLFEKVLAIRREFYGGEHADTMISMNNLALAYLHDGLVVDSLRLFEDVVSVKKRVLGEEHLDTLFSLNNLGVHYCHQGWGTKAVQVLENVLARREIILGADHIDTLRTMNDLARAYREQGNMTLSTHLYIKVLNARKRILGEEHPDTLFIMQRLIEAGFEVPEVDDACLALSMSAVSIESRDFGQ
jgi:tetratricopeptide (TPR) repeat protein